MAQLTDLTVEHVSLVDRAAVRDPSNPTQPQRFLLWKAESGATTKEESMSDKEMADLRAELAKAQEDLKTVEAERDAALAAAEAKDAEGNAEESIDKSELDPKVREALQKAEDATKAAQAEAAAATEIAKAERDLRVQKEFTELAKSEYGRVAGDAEEFGRVLKAASETMRPEDYAVLQRQLKAAEARIDSGELFAELGRTGEAAIETKPSADALAQKAEEIRKAEPSLTEYESMVLAVNQDREGAARYLAEQR